MQRKLLAVIIGVFAPLGTASAADGACTNFERRFELEKAALASPQVSALLFSAADHGCESLASRLLEFGASVASQDRLGGTALTHAARSGQTALVKLLLQNGSDPNHRMVNGSTALFVAVEKDQEDAAAELIAKGADAKIEGRSRLSPLAAAAFNANARLAALLLNSGADPAAPDATGKPPIVYAAAKGSIDIVSLLAAAGADPKSVYANGLTALMWAAGGTDGVPEENSIKVITYLIEKGAAIDAADDRGRTALMIAAELGRERVVEALLGNGASPARRDGKGLRASDLTASQRLREVLSQSPAR
jgi:uncharacterized protein